MKGMFKVCFAALALTTVAPVFAQDVEEVVDEGPVGWTPLAIGIATPLQAPWGLNRWDVFGLDVNLFYADAPKMRGLQVGGIAAVARQNFMGLQVSGIANVALQNVYGMRASLGFNLGRHKVYGFEAGLAGLRENFWGLDCHLLGSAQYTSCGLMIAGLANISVEESYGATVALGANFAKTAYGMQCAIAFNYAQELHGCQVALVNFAETCPSGFQIGLINVIMDNTVKVLPFVNAYF